MKKNILKILTCLCVIGLIWSCSTENDVKMQSGGDLKTQQKNTSIWQGQIGVVLDDGTYAITVDQEELAKEIERISAEEGDIVEITSLQILNVAAVNDPNSHGIFLYAGTQPGAQISKTMGFQLVPQAESISLTSLFDEESEGPTRISCKGCGWGCFLEYYKIDGQFVPYCFPGVCGVDCTKIKRD